ncbi:MAG: bifunctional phosphopantothenoylcysteine decarboxylase/phosphopantothenate--cysteine ligase CoaBC [Marivibrio sp.]|uniref:bifunctional phosphopantothenoylcysteine decarboxylase/phosphopantothenate--cysteine ligase CoaBC n=1 Tax=Marivibrio sp. TaxID=2039719 RepID=UPI0032EEEEAA
MAAVPAADIERRVLLIVSGGIAAYKALETVRLLRKAGVAVRCVLTRGGAQFVTALSLQALSEDKVYDDLWSLTDESEMGHIELSRQADLVVVAPASADILAKMTAGMADDLATTVLLATDKPVLVAPAMNVRMWEHAATQSNLETLVRRGVSVIGPNEGPMACGEYGPGRLVEPEALTAAVLRRLNAAPAASAGADRPLAGRRALVTSGPTHEPIDPVRYIANRSSGRQGHAIAAALAALGAEVTLVSGPTQLPDPAGVAVVRIETAAQMEAACRAALPADVAVCAAAVADWRVADRGAHKLKKRPGEPPPPLPLAENPDILMGLSAPGPSRPALVVGFAAETEKVAEHAAEKRARKGCDWILANDVSEGSGTFGGADNEITLITAEGAEPWPRQTKAQAAEALARRIADHFKAAARDAAE